MVPSGKAMPSPAGISVSVAPVDRVTLALYFLNTMPAEGKRRRVSSRRRWAQGLAGTLDSFINGMHK